MTEEHEETVNFVDIDSGSDAFAIVKASPDLVILSFSIEVDGDTLVAMNYADFERLLAAMRAAAEVARPPEGTTAPTG